MREGIRAGAFGASAAWACAFVSDALTHAPLSTPILFGRHLLAIDQVRQASPWADVLAFTVFLFAIWIGVASAAALAVRAAARRPPVLLLAALILTLLQLAAVALTTLLAYEGMGAAAWRSVYAPHLVGWLVVWWFLLRRHPELAAELRMAGHE